MMQQGTFTDLIAHRKNHTLDRTAAGSHPALGHDYVWTVLTGPGCTTEDLRRGECLRCGADTEEVIAPLGHDWSGTVCRRCGETRENPFTDVPEGRFYYAPVIWAEDRGITNGPSATQFGPNARSC